MSKTALAEAAGATDSGIHAMEEHERAATTTAVGASGDEQAAAPHGVRSGEICVRVQRDALLSGAVRGLAPALQALALTPPTLEQTIAPWTHKVEALRQRRRQIQERRRRVRDRYDATRAAMDEMVGVPERYVKQATASAGNAAAMDRYASAFHALAQLYTRHAMDGVLHYDALLEEERFCIAAWQHTEAAACQELVRVTKRRHHLTAFAVHLDSETSGQIRLQRLPEGDAQRARCLKAASENLKTGFFEAPDRTRQGTIEVTDVYKIDNVPLLRAFEQWIAHHEGPKVKGLFCCVPAESLERCVVWGMFRDEDAMAASTGGAAEHPIFNRPQWSRSKNEAPGTQHQCVAQQRVQEATPMAFPRRFSRYSTLNELRDAPSSDWRLSDAPTRYLALCRVAMGKIQRVTETNGTPEFPANAAVGSLFLADQDEYLARYPETVVPEFLVEYRFVRPAPVDPQATTKAPDRLLPVRLTGPHRELLPTAAFEASAKTLVGDLLRNASSTTSPSLLTERAGSIPSVFSGPTPATASRASGTSDDLATEKVLEICGRRRRIYADDFEQLRGLLWETTKRAWDAIDLPRKALGEAQQSRDTSRNAIENHRPDVSEEKMATTKRQSFKAKKLTGELALERRLQANDVARLDALVKGKLGLNGRLKKKDGVANRPRPFR